MKKITLIILIFSILTGCSSTKHRLLKKQSTSILNDTIFENQFLGVMVYDPLKKDTIISFNSHKYFTPASNAKIVTLYTSLQTLPERIPALKYIDVNDTLYIQGTGDPTFLHTYFKDSTTLQFLKRHENIVLYLNNFESEKFGPGWAWEDYEIYFQPERTSFPLYGNVTTIFKTDSLHVIPDHFTNMVTTIDYPKMRENYSNTFYFNPTKNDTLETPFMTDSLLTKTLLEKVLNKKIKITNDFPSGEKNVLYSVASDSVYKRMMEVSDNFLAEQLLVLSSSILSDTLSVEKAQENMLKNQLSDLTEVPRWVDGSGLSRYNLFSPASFVQILDKMYVEEPIERLFNLFPVQKSPNKENLEKNYIYAKSGSFGNNYNLSGYLITKSGKVLIFSFMNNHYKKPTSALKKQMFILFEKLRDEY